MLTGYGQHYFYLHLRIKTKGKRHPVFFLCINSTGYKKPTVAVNEIYCKFMEI